jgi:hypothetical protein
MARFYDTTSDSELLRIEWLLKTNGIVYNLKPSVNTAPQIYEILVAEEDLAFAEFLLCEKSTLSN